MKYSASKNRYSNMLYRTCGDSGVKLPLISLGLWHNFGAKSRFQILKKSYFTLLIEVLLILIWQIIMAHHMEVLKLILEK